MNKEKIREQNRIRHRRYREKNLERWRQKTAEGMRKQYAKNPKKFRKRRMKSYWKNREQILEKQRGKNKTVVNSYQREYRRRHPFRLLCTLTNRGYAEKIHFRDLFDLAKQQKLRCALTGDKLTRDNISVDHILARANGGRNIISNLRLVTRDANFMKNVHTDSKLLELCRKIVCHMDGK